MVDNLFWVNKKRPLFTGRLFPALGELLRIDNAEQPAKKSRMVYLDFGT